jgi:hypothetical protein
VFSPHENMQIERPVFTGRLVIRPLEEFPDLKGNTLNNTVISVSLNEKLGG